MWKTAHAGRRTTPCGKIEGAGMHTCSIIARETRVRMASSGFTHHTSCTRSPSFAMFVMRFTVIDNLGTVSFVAPCTALKALVAACSKAHDTLDSLLSATTRYDS